MDQAHSFTSSGTRVPKSATANMARSSSLTSVTRNNYDIFPTTTRLFATNKNQNQNQKEVDYTIDDPFEKIGPIKFVIPLLFVAQIVFLTVANLTCGIDKLRIYGDLGNQYIRSNGGYDQQKSLLERQSITSQGQKIWLDNVL